MKISDLKGQRIAFAASGGLDSCTITHWLVQNGVNVVCMTADIGQTDEDTPDAIERRMRASGATDFVQLDLKSQMAEMGMSVIQAKATYEGEYWNTTGAARNVITQGILAEMRARNIKILSHGATGRGNDQVRFQVIAGFTDPEVQFYAPWRDPEFLTRFSGRVQMLSYCEQYGIPIKATRDTPYSTDANLLGLTHEGGILEQVETPSSVVSPGMGAWPINAPDRSERIEIEFKAGYPVRLDGRNLSLVDMFSNLNEIGGRNGIGIATNLVENRFIGVKSRGVYEAPAMHLLSRAYMQILELILDRRARKLYDKLALHLAEQLYQGYWFDLSSSMSRDALQKINAIATGTVALTLYKGTIQIHSVRNVPFSLYNSDGSMESEGQLNHEDSEGFLNILSLNAKNFADVHRNIE